MVKMGQQPASPSSTEWNGGSSRRNPSRTGDDPSSALTIWPPFASSHVATFPKSEPVRAAEEPVAKAATRSTRRRVMPLRGVSYVCASVSQLGALAS